MAPAKKSARKPAARKKATSSRSRGSAGGQKSASAKKKASKKAKKKVSKAAAARSKPARPSATRKARSKKATKKTAKKAATQKKTGSKRAGSKKASAKKTTAKKTTAKKASKRAAKKSSKKAPVRKPASKKAASRQAAKPAKKRAGSKARRTRRSKSLVGGSNGKVRRVTVTRSVKSKPKAPAPRFKPFAKSVVTQFREMLLSKQKEILDLYSSDLQAGLRALPEGTDDIVDRANDAYNRELNFALSDSERILLEQIESALERLDGGLYGYCKPCDRPIARQRLEAVPWARYCIDCQELEEKGLLE